LLVIAFVTLGAQKPIVPCSAIHTACGAVDIAACSVCATAWVKVRGAVHSVPFLDVPGGVLLVVSVVQPIMPEIMT
jgi:hypothetical protein